MGLRPGAAGGRAPVPGSTAAPVQRRCGLPADDGWILEGRQAEQCDEPGVPRCLPVLRLLWADGVSVQEEDPGSRPGAAREGSNGSHDGHGASDSAVPAVCRDSDCRTFPGEADTAGRVYLCHVCQGGILPATSGEPAEPGDRAGVYGIFQGKPYLKGNIDSDVTLYLCNDCIQRHADGDLYFLL